jgi:hypothetical protein
MKSNTIKEFVLKLGADVCEIASIDRFKMHRQDFTLFIC